MEKKILSLFVTIFLFVYLSVLSHVLYAQVSYTSVFQIQDMIIDTVTGDDNEEYTNVSMMDLDYSDEPGKPLLPKKYLDFVVPEGIGIEELTYVIDALQNISIDQPVFPAQPPIPIQVDNQKPDFIPPDPNIYQSAGPWPPFPVKLVHIGYLNGCTQIVKVEVNPIIYYPQENRLKFISSISFTLEPGGTPPINPVNRISGNEKIDATFESVLANIVSNPQDISKYICKPARPTGGQTPQVSRLPVYEYVIITDDDYKDCFNDLVLWKTRKGWRSGIVTTQDILASYDEDPISGIADPAGCIRHYLFDAYTTGNTIFALLVGDHTKVPVRYGSGLDNSNHEAFIIPADLYYCDFNGDWDVDNDEFYGEQYGDNPDYYPEIFVGRIPVGPVISPDSPIEDPKIYIANWIEKVLEYEKFTQGPPGSDTDYPLKMFWIEGPNMVNPPSIVIPHCPDTFMHTVWGPHPGNEVVEEMSRNYGVVNWFCHGAPTDIRTGYGAEGLVATKDSYRPGFGNGLDNMTNRDNYSVNYSISCDIGGFDNFLLGDYPDGSMVEGWTGMFNQRCGTAILANTRYGWFGPSEQLEMNFWDMISIGHVNPGVLKNALRLGVAEHLSKIMNNYSSHYIKYAHNAFACPEQMLWTNTPVYIPDVSITQSIDRVTVSCGVPYCDICVCSADDLGATYHAFVQNVSTFTFQTQVRNLYITVTKPNYIPYLAEISQQAVLIGDVNQDGTVDIIDALLTAQCYVGLSNCPSYEIGDVNCDGTIDIIDALLIAQYYVGLISKLGC